jgi:hypothetical protein
VTAGLHSGSLHRLPWFALALVAAAPAARAAVVAVPEGGRAVPVIAEGVVCGPLPASWALDATRRMVRPPAPGAQAARRIELRTAANPDGCDKATTTVSVVATGPHPNIEPASVVFAPDEGRLELEGSGLRGLPITWQRAPEGNAEQAKSAQGTAGATSVRLEICVDPVAGGAGRPQRCVIPLESNLRSDTRLVWLPPGTPYDDDLKVYDARGALVPADQRMLRPARVLISQVLLPGATVDVSQGPARVPLRHPQSVSSVDCGAARCEVEGGAVIVRSVSALATQLPVRLRLAPRFFLSKAGGGREDNLAVTLPLVQCPLQIASGPPLRDAEEARIVVRMDPRCARERERARWSVNGNPVEVRRVVRVDEAAFVVLQVGRVVADRLVVTASRGDFDATLIGSVTANTDPAPRPRVTLELPKHGKVEFLPTNRDAVLTVAGARAGGTLVPLPIEGAYSVRPAGSHYLIRGDENAGGFVALRFGYRITGLPAELANLDVAVLSDRVQRAVREASVPAPFSTSAEQPEPLIELTCTGRDGKFHRVPPSKLHHIAYDAKDSCRLIVHRQRLKPEFGLQEVLLEVEVNRAEGGRRPEVSFTERMILVPGGEAREIPLKGGTEEFDRILVRVSHVLDESRYALSPTGRQGLPSIQWPLAIEGGRLRLYATAAIPAGLYRINKPTGQLTLNFGVLSRLTWLNDRGKEGLLGAEIGLMGMGLIQRPGAIDYPPTIGAVAGMGIRVPLGGGAAVGVHVWAAYEFRESFNYRTDLKAADECDTLSAVCKRAPRVAFIFGPSISIGNVGTNL